MWEHLVPGQIAPTFKKKYIIIIIDFENDILIRDNWNNISTFNYFLVRDSSVV